MFLHTNWVLYSCLQSVQHPCVSTGYHTPVCNLCDIPVYHLGTILLFMTLWCILQFQVLSSPFLHLSYLWHLPLIAEAIDPHSSLKQYSMVQTFVILSILCSTVMSLHSVHHLFMPFYKALYTYTLWGHNAIQPSLQIRTTLTLSNGLLSSPFILQCHQQLTHDCVWTSLIATLMEKPQTNGYLLWSLSFSLPSPACKHCNQFCQTFLLYSLIVVLSADPRFLSDWLVQWPWTLFFI